MSPREGVLGGLMLACLGACGSEPPSYQILVAERLRAELPGASVVADGADVTVHVGARSTRVDVAEIQRLCSRGPRDCEHALGSAVERSRGDAR